MSLLADFLRTILLGGLALAVIVLTIAACFGLFTVMAAMAAVLSAHKRIRALVLEPLRRRKFWIGTWGTLAILIVMGALARLLLGLFGVYV